MSRPAGLSPIMVEQMLETIKAVNGAGLAVLMIEQNAVAALRISRTGIVMAAGRIVMRGLAQDLLADASVGELYLGAAA